MADVIITSIVGIVSALCSCSANNRCCYLLDLQENKEALNNALLELRATRNGVKIRVDEAENNPNQERTPEVNNWLQGVQTIDDEVVQVIQKVDQEIEGRCFGTNCPINCWSGHKIGKLVIQELAIVKEHKSKGDLFVDVAYRLPPPLVQREPVELTVGMESMFDKVWRLLAEDEVRIMGLYGYGGVGKITLLKQINNEFLKTTTSSSNNNNSSNLHGFDVVILVVVSKPVNIDAIQKEIGSRLGLLSSPTKINIFNALTKKNFVLLLDDIWERVDLQSIGIPPRLENKKSKVVFTTRSEIVCGHMDANTKFRVECLPWDKARITIGRAMSFKKTVQEWNHAITTLQRYASEFPGMGDDVLPLLKLSYDNLGDAMIKSCFLYCALFPEDFSIFIPKLIDYWIGEGLISLSDFNHIDEARNKGYDIIGILKGACLLENGEYEESTSVKMHDTIRDLALWIAHDCESKRDKMLIIKTSDLTAETSSSWYNNAERIYLIPSPLPPPPPPPYNGETEEEEEEEEVRSPSPLKSPKLITLMFSLGYNGLPKLPQNFFEFTHLIRVLDLSNSGMETFPMCITELVELRYLSLSRTTIEEIPEELGKLVKLKHLDLSDMFGLKKIPSGVIGGSLLELRVLNLYGCYQVDWDIDEVYKLKHLNDLRISINTEDNLNKLLSNQNLQMCTRLLYLEGIPKTNMGIEQQQQHLGSSCFQNLRKIQIFFCHSLKDLTWVGYVPNLKTLGVSNCKELEEIIIVIDDLRGSKGGGNEIIFKSLKTLRLQDLPKLKSICRNALAFPCLESMYINNCPQLKKRPRLNFEAMFETTTYS